ncbi:hypothetical protein VTK26DRAFT_1943 [Humicola hyalothermophila]
MIASTKLVALAGLAGQAFAATIPVSVGRDGLTFDPNVIHAHEGDVIEFRFWPRNHSVVAGDFHDGCRPARREGDGFFSGFFPTEPGTVNDQVFRVTVTHTGPVPVYCSQNNGQHCRNGMVAVINPAGRFTLEAYAALARNVPGGNATSPQGGPFGGVVAQNTGTVTTATATATATETDTDTETETSASEAASLTITVTTTTTTATISSSSAETTQTETEARAETETDAPATETETATTTGGGGGGEPTATGGASAVVGGGMSPFAGLAAALVAAVFV